DYGTPGRRYLIQLLSPYRGRGEDLRRRASAISLARLERDRDRLGRGLVAAGRDGGHRDQDVRLRIVRRRAAARDLVGHDLELRGAPARVAKMADDVAQRVLRVVALPHILGVQEDAPAPAEDAAIAIVLAVDRRVELVVAAQRRQQQAPAAE